MSSTPSVTETKPPKVQQKRGCLFYIGRGLLGFVSILVVLVILGVIYQTVATQMDKSNFSPRGDLYTINGHQIHMVCIGEGSPPVILQAGLSADSLWFYRIQTQLAQHTQVCAYDRPGMGWSEPTTDPRDAVAIAAELHTLLQQAGISAPYVMGGHSYGAIWARIYTAQYPQEVAGLVLIDSGLVNPQQFASQSEFEQWKTSNDAIQLVLWGAYRTGLVRLTSAGDFERSGYPSEIVPELVALHSANQAFDATYEAQIPVMLALTESSAAAENFGDLPMAVLWASETNTMMQMIPDLRTLHDEIATYSTNTTVEIVEGASHGSILGNEQSAQQVTDAILNVLEAARP